MTPYDVGFPTESGSITELQNTESESCQITVSTKSTHFFNGLHT